jgi:hypothetical protein
VSAEQDDPTLHMSNLHKPSGGMQVYVITFHTGHRNVSRHSSHGINCSLAAGWAPLLECRKLVNRHLRRIIFQLDITFSTRHITHR